VHFTKEGNDEIGVTYLERTPFQNPLLLFKAKELLLTTSGRVGNSQNGKKAVFCF